MSHWYATTETERWKTQSSRNPDGTEPVWIRVTSQKAQPFWGAGGCVNELGWRAMAALSSDARRAVLTDLFGETGCNFRVLRIPIGASDYAAGWYSLAEVAEDYALESFSIERDSKSLIPYVRSALDAQPRLLCFASPWSPPAWMKEPPVYNYGRLRSDPAVQGAYARYLAKFVEAYRAEGIEIAQLHVQNEPLADQKFPSCIWEGTQMRTFITEYLAPVLRERALSTEIWLGTINSDDYDGWASLLLSDPRARAAIAGVGYQWGGKGAIQRTHQSYPDVPLMQTENECGDGTNSWSYAHYVFNLIQHYVANGARAYVYWNMILAPGGRSTWGWRQNAMISIDPASGRVDYNPEFFVMKHLSHAVQPDAARAMIEGPWSSHALAFVNADKSTVVVLSNPLPEERTVRIEVGGEQVAAKLAPASFHTFVFGAVL